MRERGQSLIEVMVALSVATIVITSLLVVVINSLRNAQFAQSQQRATKYATEGLEKIRTLRDRDGVVNFNHNGQTASRFSDFWGFSMSQTCSTSTSSGCNFRITPEGILSKTTLESEAENLEGGLSRQIIFEDNISNYQTEKTVIVKVKWQDSTGNHESNLQTILTKPI